MKLRVWRKALLCGFEIIVLMKCQKQKSFCILKDLIDRSSHRKCSVRKDVLRNFAKFTGKHLRQSFFFNKVASFSLQLHLKRDSGTAVLLWIFEISKNTFFHRAPLSNSFWSEIWRITCYLKDLRTLLKTLRFVYYSKRTPYWELHGPTKNLLF